MNLPTKTNYFRFIIHKLPWIIALGLGILLGRSCATHRSTPMEKATTQAIPTDWTCAMHPQVHLPKFGACPLCGMDLIPATAAGSNGSYASEGILANVETMRIKHTALSALRKRIAVSGKARLHREQSWVQNAHVAGRIDRLMITENGQYITKGSVLAHIYAPELVRAQQELIQAKQSNNTAWLQAAKQKLYNLQVSTEQIKAWEKLKTPQQLMPIVAKRSGLVMNNYLTLGQYVAYDEPLVAMNDLKKVWVTLDLYERDFGKVQLGDSVSLTMVATEQVLFGVVSFIDPVVVKNIGQVSIEVVNESTDGYELVQSNVVMPRMIVPGMMVLGQIYTRLGSEQQGILIPKNALLWTGEQSIVYQKQDKHFVARHVRIINDLDQIYVLAPSMPNGTEIATEAVFTLDASAQLAGLPSMMQAHTIPQAPPSIPPSIAPSNTETSSTQALDLQPLITQYLRLKKALVQSDYPSASKAISALNARLKRTAPCFVRRSKTLCSKPKHSCYLISCANSIQ